MNHKLDITNITKEPHYFTQTNVLIKIEMILKNATSKTRENFNFIIDDCTISLCKPITVNNYATLLAIEFINIKQLDQKKWVKESFFPKTELTIDQSNNSTSELKINLWLTDSKAKVFYPIIFCTISSPFYLRYCNTNLVNGACFILISKTKSYSIGMFPDLKTNYSKTKNSLRD